MSQKIEQSQLKRWYKEINWGVHRRLVEDIFHKEALRAEQDGFFEKLYVSVNYNNRQIQLAAGTHPAGPLEQVFDQKGNRTGQFFPTESGASLVISQGGDGSVSIFLYPFASERMRMKVPYIIWAVFSDPTKLTSYVLHDVTRDFFIYMNVSSVHLSETFYERFRIKLLELKGLRYSDNGGILPFIVRNWVKETIILAGATAGVLALFK
ncbi:TPA: hypothetical protein ACKPZM_004655 [Serratia marcescens]|nr:hypothetical protein [Serratia marcescens]